MNAEMGLLRLLSIMARLRDPVDGCAWDNAQSWESIAPYTIEEAYEVSDAIDHGTVADVREELGDLLLQVVFQSRIAEEAGHFTFDDVANGIADKMERRHPQIFAGFAIPPDWETLKATERAEKQREGTLDGVASALPALTRADKLQRRAARTGFDWVDANGPRLKIDEELIEVETASPDALAGEIGDLLFSVVNWARHLGVNAEHALRTANTKFERRFTAMQFQSDGNFVELDLNAKEALWQRVKESGA